MISNTDRISTMDVRVSEDTPYTEDTTVTKTITGACFIFRAVKEPSVELPPTENKQSFLIGIANIEEGQETMTCQLCSFCSL